VGLWSGSLAETCGTDSTKTWAVAVPHISVIDPQNRPTLLGLTETHIDLSSVCGSIFEAHSVETRKRPANRPAGNDRS
jgi:hypothetical protein